ncbi:PP2C family protein-serine/threonine phosphatase [Thermotomaculum hydrothermale]|nr:PP2C family protein-serine/threonine phosphatase [Thermotomaculum hydrothermale]
MLEKEKLEKEIMIAKEIQQKLLPINIPDIKGLEIQTGMITYHQVGGDYYDILPINKNKTLIIIADVSGKGIPASLIMSAVQSSVKTLILKGVYDLEKIAYTLNKLLITITESNKFVALSLILIDKNSNKIEYLNAGHTAPLLFSGGKIKKLKEGGPVIGLLDFASYKKHKTEFRKGDFIFMYTDGISEAKNLNGEEIGEEGIIKLIHEGKNQQDLSTYFKKKLFEITNQVFEDDITYIYVKKV